MDAGSMPQLTQLMQRGVLAATHLLLLACLVKGLWLAAAAAVAAVAAAKYAKVTHSDCDDCGLLQQE